MKKPIIAALATFFYAGFILITLVTVFTGCISTQGKLLIKGKVEDESTKTGIPRKVVMVQGLIISNNKSESIEAGQFTTDSSGHFTYLLRKVKDARNYSFSFIGDSDYVYTTRTLGLMVLHENAKYLSFSLNKLVGLTIKLNRKSNKPACDTLRLVWESDGVYGWSLYPYRIINFERNSNTPVVSSALDLIWIGGYVNSTITTKVFADKRTKLSWELYRNGRRRIFTDTITCQRDFANIVRFTY